MDSYEQIRERVAGWMGANRKGDQEKEPCYWSLYAISSINGTPAKNGSTNCDNYHVEQLEESVDYLMERMGDSPHVKYYAVRLRTKRSDPGPICNFPNPHYKNYTSSINGFGGMATNEAAGGGLTWNMIGMLQNNMEQRLILKEEITQARLDAIQKQNELQMQQFMEKMESKQKIKQLKEENEALKNAKPQSVLTEFLQECKTEIFDLAKWKINGQIPYSDSKIAEHVNDDEREESKEEVLLDKSIELLKNNVKRPEELIYKMAFVIDNLPEDQAQMILGMLQTNYEELKKKKTNENL